MESKKTESTHRAPRKTIIAILAAILFPVFAQAREKARQSACLSNQKQMGLAIMRYVQDYDETYPFCYVYKNNSGSGGGYKHWSGIFQPYVKNWAPNNGFDFGGRMMAAWLDR